MDGCNGGVTVEYRYRDKAYLSNYMLDTRLFDSFDFLVEDAAPVRSVYILTTNQGIKILKKVDYSLEELMFIYNSLNSIREKYPYVINYRLSTDGNPYVEYEGGLYVVLDLINGRECVYENPIDLKTALEALAKLHSAGEGIDTNCSTRCGLFMMPDKIKTRIRDMKKYKKIAQMHVNKSYFDSLYLEYVDYYISYAIKAHDYIENSNYKELCKTHHTLCHHDLAHHNILIGNDEKVYFLDFDYSLIDIPYHDIANIITKAIKHNGWNIDTANLIMDSYMKYKPMTKDEIEVLYSYLLFPQDFYDISTSYYMRTRNWDEDEFVSKLRTRAGYKDDREKFLEEFKTIWIDNA